MIPSSKHRSTDANNSDANWMARASASGWLRQVQNIIAVVAEIAGEIASVRHRQPSKRVVFNL